ncbi:MAG TPA: FtsQ-type POTRA domain-containing protein [Methylomirabilota bacterium]|nr:FtsQ-type POTRA domain-containing protein [Methylomirabilota bacterium]
MWPFRKKKNKVFQQPDLLDLEGRIGPKRRQQVRHFCNALGVTIAVVMAGWSLWWGSEALYSQWVLKNEALALKRLDIRSNGLIPAAQIQKWARVKEGDNLLALDLSQIKRNLELVPLVEHAGIERLFPDTLRIFVAERRPIAQVRAYQTTAGQTGMAPQLFYLDRDGYVLLPLEQQAEAWRRLGESIPHISGINADLLRPGRQITAIEVRSALEFIERFKKSPLARRELLRNIDLSEKQAMRVSTSSGAEVSLALQDFQGQLARWRAVHDLGVQQRRELATLDLAITNYVPLRWVVPEEQGKTNKPAAATTASRKRNV